MCANTSAQAFLAADQVMKIKNKRTEEKAKKQSTEGLTNVITIDFPPLRANTKAVKNAKASKGKGSENAHGKKNSRNTSAEKTPQKRTYIFS